MYQDCISTQPDLQVTLNFCYYLLSSHIPDSYYSLIITTSYMILSVLVPTQATKFGSRGHLHNGTVHLCIFIHNLEGERTGNNQQTSNTQDYLK